MKMRAAQKVHYDAGPNMTPLVDVVMVILIFLMLTGSFAVGEHFLQSNMPVTKKGAGQVNDKSVPDEPLEIRVDSFTRPGPDGVSVDMWAAQAGGFMIQNNTDQLVGQLTKMREALNKNNQSTDKIQVIINPGRQTKYRHLIDVYQAALRADFTKVSFSTAH
jgi:biopolymer transport protein ExbD